jgi:hypothetical protein
MVGSNNGYGQEDHPRATGKKAGGYEFMDVFHEDLARVKRKGKWGFVDDNRYEVIPCRFDYVEDFHEKRAVFRNGRVWGAIDPTGAVVVPPIYNWICSYCAGTTTVQYGRKYGVINQTGEEVIPCWYDIIERNADDTFNLTLYIPEGDLVFRFDTEGHSLPLT